MTRKFSLQSLSASAKSGENFSSFYRSSSFFALENLIIWKKSSLFHTLPLRVRPILTPARYNGCEMISPRLLLHAGCCWVSIMSISSSWVQLLMKFRTSVSGKSFSSTNNEHLVLYRSVRRARSLRRHKMLRILLSERKNLDSKAVKILTAERKIRFTPFLQSIIFMKSPDKHPPARRSHK